MLGLEKVSPTLKNRGTAVPILARGRFTISAPAVHLQTISPVLYSTRSVPVRVILVGQTISKNGIEEMEWTDSIDYSM